MALWKFLDYLADDKVPRNLIQAWYGQQDLNVQAAFDATVAALAATEDWRKAKDFGLLKGGILAWENSGLPSRKRNMERNG